MTHKHEWHRAVVLRSQAANMVAWPEVAAAAFQHSNAKSMSAAFACQCGEILVPHWSVSE